MKIHSFLSQGFEVSPIEVQVHFRFQIPCFQIQGLAGPEIQEARERIVAAFASCELEFPKKKVIVNLSPSDLKKNGTAHDLPIALAILIHHEDGLSKKNHKKTLFAWGTLGLNGVIEPGGKIASLLTLLCQDPSPKILFLCPPDAQSLQELKEWRRIHGLSLPQNLEIRVIRNLGEWDSESLDWIYEKKEHAKVSFPELLPLLPHQERLLDISIVGRHHTLILGPKGMGKSQMLEWFRWVSPESAPEKTWTRFIYEETHIQNPSYVLPFRSVHSQVKPAHLLGSWNSKGFRAGELSLAHGGILVADEFLEWSRDAKECLREPLQNRKTAVTRVQGKVEIECDFQLLATGNLCPCGGLPQNFQNRNTRLQCRCPPAKVEEYLRRLSGPIADRIDLVSVFREEPKPETLFQHPRMRFEDLYAKKQTLLEAREFAIQHFGAIPSELSVTWLEKNFPKDPDWESLFHSRVTSLRSRHKAMRVARTIQALARSPELKPEHLLEALQFRFEQ